MIPFCKPNCLPILYRLCEWILLFLSCFQKHQQLPGTILITLWFLSVAWQPISVEAKPYILRRGDLGSAIRASMTFPFYFKPIRLTGACLFDGGMYNNFPSDVVMEDFFPDIIIGSKAAGNYTRPNEDDVVSQLKSMLMGETKFNMYCDASVLIEPELKPVNLIDFSNTDSFYRQWLCVNPANDCPDPPVCT